MAVSMHAAPEHDYQRQVDTVLVQSVLIFYMCGLVVSLALALINAVHYASQHEVGVRSAKMLLEFIFFL